MKNFNSLELHPQLLSSLEQLQYTTPTSIQEKVIPIALKGKDVLGSAPTGTGKTAAYGIPLISQLLLDPKGTALVIVPTRELALQVMKMLHSLIGKRKNSAPKPFQKFDKKRPFEKRREQDESPAPTNDNGYINSALLIGGEPIFKQLRDLKDRPRLIVGTPGRINDHLLRKSLKLGEVKFLVLDEADRMLDMGFTPQIDSILKFIPQQRQTLLFSATLPKNIITMSEKYLNHPERVSVGATIVPAANIKQEIIHTSEENKYSQLTEQLDKREGSVIVFVKTKSGADKMVKRLRLEKHSADVIHGDLSHQRRGRAISAFRERKYRIMVATDVAARGLDIDHVKHVINYDLPQCPEDYIHRIGRTARAGAEGSALCLIVPSDRGKWRAIDNMMNPGAPGSKPARSDDLPFDKKKRGKGGRPAHFKRARKPFGNRPQAAAA